MTAKGQNVRPGGQQWEGALGRAAPARANPPGAGHRGLGQAGLLGCPGSSSQGQGLEPGEPAAPCAWHWGHRSGRGLKGPVPGLTWQLPAPGRAEGSATETQDHAGQEHVTPRRAPALGTPCPAHCEGSVGIRQGLCLHLAGCSQLQQRGRVLSSAEGRVHEGGIRQQREGGGSYIPGPAGHLKHLRRLRPQGRVSQYQGKRAAVGQPGQQQGSGSRRPAGRECERWWLKGRASQCSLQGNHSGEERPSHTLPELPLPPTQPQCTCLAPGWHC